MYFYGPGCLDDFFGFFAIEDYLKEKMLEDDQKFKNWLQGVMTDAFFEVDMWDDEKTPSIWIGHFLDTDLCDTRTFLIWKQSNNGCTFLASPYPLENFRKDFSKRKPNHENIQKCNRMMENIFGRLP